MQSLYLLVILMFTGQPVFSRKFRNMSANVPRRIKSERSLNDLCEVSKNEAIDALQELTLLGNSNMFLPEDHCDIFKHCDNVAEKANIKLKHIKCLKGTHAKLIYKTLAKAHLRENEKRCSSKEWREKFLRFSDCLRTSSVAADVHQCGYKLHDAYQYSVDNFDIDHQLQFACCATQLIKDCIQNQLINDCGKDVAEFAPGLFWEPGNEIYPMTCPGIESMKQCQQMYPKEMKDMEKLFYSNKKLTPRNFLKHAYAIHVNRGDSFPEYAPVSNK